MKAQVRYETQGRATRAGGRRGSWQRFSPAAAGLLGGLLCAALFFSSTGQALAGQPGREMSSPGLLAVLNAQTREVVAQSQHFVNDLRLLYQISQLEPLATETVAAPAAAPVAPAEPECKEAETPLRLARFHSARISVNAKLISSPERTVALGKLDKARS